MDSKTEPASEAKERIENEADKYVKLQGTHDKPEITKHDYITGATAEYNRAQEEITRLKAELEREREFRSYVMNELHYIFNSAIRNGWDLVALKCKQMFEKAKN